LLVWYFTFLHAGNIFLLQEQTFCCADGGRFRESLKIKKTGKTAETQLMEREIQDLDI
jgi:hypothetical protein